MKKRIGFICFALVLLLASCGKKDEIVISGKTITEQLILPHLLGIYIEENTDYKVSYKEGLGAVGIMTPALEKGEIDLYVEYTGTGLKEVLGEETENEESSESVYERVKEGYEKELGATWTQPLGFENGYTLIYSGEQSFDVATYSELAAISAEEDLVFGAPHAFYERQGDGYEDLVETYSFTFADTKSLDPNVMYEAVKSGEVDIVPGFTTESRLQQFDLMTTEDDLDFFPKYDAAPVVRQEVLEKYPELEELLNKLAGKISNEEMLSMNAEVDVNDRKHEDVAREFLIEKGLISK